MKNILLICSLLISQIIPQISYADYVGAVSSATGETGIAAVEASETAYMNPAALGHTKGYYFTTGMSSTRQTNVGNNQDFSLSVTDAMAETVVATAFSYVQKNLRFEGQADDSISREFKLSFGNMIYKKVAFGLAIAHNNDRVGVDVHQQTNVDSGLLWTPNSNIGLGVLFRNAIPPKDSVPELVRQQQRMGLGASYNYKKFVRVKMDINSAANNALNYPMIGAGMESFLNRWLVVRWGLARDNEVKADQYSAGMGFLGPKFALNYAYQTSPQNERLTRHSVDLAVPIWQHRIIEIESGGNMASKTQRTEHQRKRKNANQGKKRKAANRTKGTTKSAKTLFKDKQLADNFKFRNFNQIAR